eukprot:11222456-Lingulodinium_polyedra.AAC.1
MLAVEKVGNYTCVRLPCKQIWPTVSPCFGALRRAETAKRAFGRVAAQRFAKRCAMTRSNTRFAASTRRSAAR